MPNFSFALIVFFLGACTTASQQLNHRLEIGEPVTKVFLAPYDDVITALRLAMLDYPQQHDDPEAGFFQTALIRGHQIWRPAHLESNPWRGMRYRIHVRVIRGAAAGRREATRVEITKKMEQPSDFFSEARPVASDGLEEQALLYRIGRELRIARELEAN